MAADSLELSEKTLQEEWEAIVAAKKALAERERAFDGALAYVVSKGRADWVPKGYDLGHPTLPAQMRPGKTPATSGTWASELVASVRHAQKGLTLAEIREMLAKGPMALRLKMNPNGFYTAINRAEEGGEIERYRGRVFTPTLLKVFHANVAAGVWDDLEDETVSSTMRLVLEYIRGNPGAEKREVVAALKGKSSNQAVYTNLQKALSRELIRKEGDRFFPAQENEPPSGTPGDGSETGQRANAD
jgi:hypothetical protein